MPANAVAKRPAWDRPLQKLLAGSTFYSAISGGLQRRPPSRALDAALIYFLSPHFAS